MSVHKDTATLNFHIEDHEVKLLRSLYLQTQEGRFHDITLTAHGVGVRAHQAVLCARSEYFEAFLSGRWSTTATHDLSYLFWSADTLRVLVNFMYTGKVEITKDNIEELLNTATHLLMEDLRGACSKYLLANLAPKNCISIWKLADTYQLQEVEVMCQAIATSRFQDYILKTKDLLELDESFMSKVIQRGLFDQVAKDEVLKFVLAWQQHHKMGTLSCEILQLIESDIPLQTTNQPQKNIAQLELITTSDIDDIDMVDNEETMDEAIFGYFKIKDGAARDMQSPVVFDIYMYLTRQNMWKFINRIDDSSWGFLLQTEHVGFIDHEAVYDGGVKHRSAFVDYQTNTFKTISFPNKTALSRRMFCFDSQLFLLEDHKDTDSGVVKHAMYVWEIHNLVWVKLLDFEICQLFPWAQTTSPLLSYSVVSQHEQTYIWAQDQTRQSTGPFWMSLQKDPSSKYVIVPLERVPLTKEDLRLPTQMSIRGWRHATFRLSGDKDKIYAYRKQTLYKDTLKFDILLMYDRGQNSWTRKENIDIDLPSKDNLPYESNIAIGSSNKAFVQLDNDCTVQSLYNGSTYFIEKVCPFVSRMWAGHVGRGTWQRLTPPPVEGVEGFDRFNAVSIPKDLARLLGTSPVYQGISDDAPHSPLLHWHLGLSDKLSDIKLESAVAQQFQSCLYAF